MFTGLSSEEIFYLIILIAAPILGSTLIAVINVLIDKEIAPYLPQINSNSFSQAIAALALAILVTRNLSQSTIIIGLMLIIALFFVLLVQAWLDKRQEKITQDHVRYILETKLKFKDGINLNEVLPIAFSLVDVDFFPKSIPNIISDFPRKRRREHLVNFINRHLRDPQAGSPIDQTDILVPPAKQRWLKFFSILISVVSLLIYCISVSLLVLSQ